MKQHRFKKLTALVLSVVMLLSLAPVTALGSTGDVEDVISLAYAGETNLYEGSDQFVMYDENGELSWVTDSYLTYAAEYDITYVTNVGGGETEQRTERLSGYDIYNMTEGAFQITGEHNGNAPWKAGETYHATVTVGGASCQVTLTIQEHPIQSIEYAGSEPIVLVKGEDGSPMSDGGWHYDIGNRSDIKFSVDLYSDGSTSSFTGSVGEIWEKANAYLQFYYDHDQDESQITKAWVGRDGLVCPVAVKIYTNGNSFTGITPVSPDPVELEESIDGYFTYASDETEYFVYMLSFAQAKPKFTVTLSDVGMEKYGMDTNSFTGTIEEIENRFGIVVREESTQATPDMPGGETWTVGDGQHTIKLVLPGGANYDVPVTIVPRVDTSLFAAVSLKDPDEVFVLREGADAQYCIDGKFMYDPLINNDPTFVVTLTEYGKTHLGFSSDTVEMKASDIYSLGSYFMLNDGDEETVMNYQVGQSYEYVTYLDGTFPCTLHVKVEKETQVKSVSCLTDPVLLIENYDFDREYGCSAEQALWDGRVQFKVALNNGDSFTGTYNEIWNQLGFGPIFDGSSFLDAEYCTVGKTHQFVFYLGGKSCTLNGTLTAEIVSNVVCNSVPQLVDGAHNYTLNDDPEITVTLTATGKSIYGKETVTGPISQVVNELGFPVFWYRPDEEWTAGNTYQLPFRLANYTGSFTVSVVEGTKVALNAANFPDAVFRQYLADCYDFDDDGVITAEAVNSIDCYGMGIESLSGIEKFPMLASLVCSNNQLTALDVSENTALKELNCYNNQLTALNVGKNTALQSLDCGENQLTTLDVSNNTALQYLACSSNRLAVLDVSQNTALDTLYAGFMPDTLITLHLPANIHHWYTNGDNQLITVTQNGARLTKACSIKAPSNGDTVLLAFYRIDPETGEKEETASYSVSAAGNLYLDTIPDGKYAVEVYGNDEANNYQIIIESIDELIERTVYLVDVGDLNGNASMDITDLQCLYDYLTTDNVGDGLLVNDPDYFKAVADVNDDSLVDVYDLQLLYETVNGLIS